MYLKNLGDSVFLLPNISPLADNSSRLYAIDGTLFFDGDEVGSGSGDASNVWTNANDHTTYTTLSSLIDTVQANVTSLPNSAANDHITYTALSSDISDAESAAAANDYTTYTTLAGFIDTVQDNVAALPDSAANDFNTYTTVAGLINTVQDNVTALPNSAANDYTTYTTLAGFIDTVQDNIAIGVTTDAITPSSDDSGYVGNAAKTWSSGRFTDFTVDNNLLVSQSLTVEGNLTVTGNVVTVNATELAIEDNMIYLNANAATANPDLGFAGGYNDGSYAHAGFFRDASDGYWKVFEGYTPEPDDSPYINTAHESFTLAVIQSKELRGNLVAASAVVNSVDVLANDFNSYNTVTALIDTVQDNVAALPDTAGTLLDLSGTTFNVDLSELATSTTNDHGDYFVVIDSSNAQRKLTKGSINISEFNNDAGYVTSAGVWTEDTGRAYYVGKVVVNSSSAQTEQFYVSGAGKVSGNFEVGGTLTESSSVKLKENIVPLGDQLSKLMLLRPVEYDKIKSSQHEYGLIAEEVAEILPEVVSEDQDSIQYTRLVPTLIKAIQELKAEIEELKSGRP